jgi:hypothetical protein
VHWTTQPFGPTTRPYWSRGSTLPQAVLFDLDDALADRSGAIKVYASAFAVDHADVLLACTVEDVHQTWSGRRLRVAATGCSASAPRPSGVNQWRLFDHRAIRNDPQFHPALEKLVDHEPHCFDRRRGLAEFSSPMVKEPLGCHWFTPERRGAEALRLSQRPEVVGQDQGLMNAVDVTGKKDVGVIRGEGARIELDRRRPVGKRVV